MVRKRRAGLNGSGSISPRTQVKMEDRPGHTLREDSTVSMIPWKTENRYKKKFILVILLCVILLGTTLTFCILYSVSRENKSSTISSSAGNRNQNAGKVCCRGLQSSFSPFTYSCSNGACKKTAGQPKTRAAQINTCKLTCGEFGGLWPRPRNKGSIGNETIPFIPSNIILRSMECIGAQCRENKRLSNSVTKLVETAFELFVNTTKKTCFPNAEVSPSVCDEQVRTVQILITLFITSEESRLTLNTSEAYKLTINNANNLVSVNISADTFFGARHGFETLSQLISYDEIKDSLQIVSKAEISDSPAYPYRGVMLDTSRNFFSVKSILRLLDAMSYSKLNTFHWHITDTHSFPIFVKSQPELSLYGAYSQRQVYSQSDVKAILDHALVRGIRVLPEFDQPAHVGNGWQFGEKASKGKLAFCVNAVPWQSYCVEPPCGQINPLNENVYDVLNKVYQDYVDRFNPDIFHFGGDEVNINCWNTSKEVIDYMASHGKNRTMDDFMEFWNLFLVKAVKKFKKIKPTVPLILWSSKMTEPEYLTKFLDNKTYIIQLWNKASDKSNANVLNKGFRVIFSNYDHTYLDCGFGSWINDGNNWCSPYKEWQLFYNLHPRKFFSNLNISFDRLKDQVLGGEANMWSEQVDEHSAEMKIWPRAAGLAERLWADPIAPWRDADWRMLHHRQRLVERGINADALKPLWCYQNTGYCKG